MQQSDLGRVREILSGRPVVRGKDTSEEEEIGAALISILADLAEFVDALPKSAGFEQVSVREAVSDLSGQLRIATSRAQVLHMATQGQPRERQRRLDT